MRQKVPKNLIFLEDYLEHELNELDELDERNYRKRNQDTGSSQATA